MESSDIFKYFQILFGRQAKKDSVKCKQKETNKMNIHRINESASLEADKYDLLKLQKQ